MFNFFKRKKDIKVQDPQVKPVDLDFIEDSEEEKKQLLEIKEKIKDLDSSDLSIYYSEIASLYENISIDETIKYLEKSLEADKSNTYAQSNLVKLYNVKRKELAKSGQVDKALAYLDKIDYVLKQSKDSIRGI